MIARENFYVESHVSAIKVSLPLSITTTNNVRFRASLTTAVFERNGYGQNRIIYVLSKFLIIIPIILSALTS